MIYRFAGITIDEDRDEIRREGEVVPAQKKVRDLLLYLIRRRERLVPREELFEALWPGVVVNEGALTQALYAARRAVGDDARRPRVLQTVRGRGVRFVAEVEPLEPEVARPAPSAASGPGTAPPFVGREGLLEELGGTLRAADAGEGGVFLMAGEPGIGKTRTAEEFAARARARGAAVHVGRCHEAPGAPAFWPWVQLLRSLAASCEADELVRLLGPGAEDVAQIAPEVVPGGSTGARTAKREREALLDPGPARFRLFDAVTQLWRRTAEATGPVVVVIDDLHRADPPSWRLLHFLARELRDARILVVGTYRDADAHRDPETAELLAELARQPGVRSVQLDGLRRLAVAAMVEATTGRTAETAVLEALLERTNGNPFFLTHLVELLKAANAEGSAACVDPARIALPRTLREAVTRQLNSLPEDCRHVLRAASVIGRWFKLSVIEDAMEQSRAEIIDALDTCATAGLVQAASARFDHFRFAHILVRDALYESLPATRRARLHERVGIALEQAQWDDFESTLEELAHHFSAASILGDVTRALEYTRRSAALARSRLAFEDAARHYGRALDLLDQQDQADETLRCQILLDLGEAQTRAGRREEARTNFSKAASLASRLGATDKLAEVALAAAPGFFSIESGIFDSFTVSLLEWALDSLPHEAHRLRAQTLSRLAMALYWSDAPQRRAALVREAADAAGATDDPSASAYALAARYAALWTPKTVDDRVSIGPKLRTLADATRDLSLEFMSRVFEITTLLEQGHFPQYYEAVGEFERLATLHDDLHARWYAYLFRANVALMQGQLDESMRLARVFHEVGTRLGDVNASQAFVGYWATTALARGNLRGLAEGARAQASQYPKMVCWQCAEALLYALSGRSVEADSVLDRLAETDLSAIPKDMNLLVSLGLLSFASGVRGAKECAEVLLNALRPYADRHLVVGYASLYWGSAARPLGVLAAMLGREREAGEYRALAKGDEKHGGISLGWADALAEARWRPSGSSDRDPLVRFRESLDKVHFVTDRDAGKAIVRGEGRP